MKRIESMRKRRLFWQPVALLSCLGFLMITVLATSLAWFTTQDRRTNAMRMTQQAASDAVSVTIEEEETEPPTIPPPTYPDFDAHLVDEFPNPGTSTIPNAVIEKRVGAVNTKTIPAFVRLVVEPRILMADGKTVLPAKLGQQVLITDLNTADWRAGNDGFFYYLHILQPGQSTDAIGQNLFNHVQLAAGLDQELYNGAQLKIEAKCEAVRAYRWDYRLYWWGSDAAPAANPLVGIDTILAGLL